MPTESCKCHLVNSKDPEFFHFKVAEGEGKKMLAKSLHFSLFENNIILWLSEPLTDDYQAHTKSNDVSPGESVLMPFHPSHCSLTGMDGLPGSPPAVPGVGSEVRMIKMLKGDSLMISVIQPEGENVSLTEVGGLEKFFALGRMLVGLSSGFSMSEITVHNHCIS